MRADPDFDPNNLSDGFNRDPHHLQPLEKQLSVEVFEELLG